MRMGKRGVLVGMGAAAGITALKMWRRRNFEVRGKTVFITGGSRGLGLLLAREFAARGAKVAIAARDRDALARATADIRRFGEHVLAIETDITMREEADTALERIRGTFGPVDILVNNAGTICVGPLELMTIDDFRDSVNTHFWGPYFASMAVLPEMRRRKAGRIVNISSIGGKISVPHLLPYSVGKFALTGFSEGLRAALLVVLNDHGLPWIDAHWKSTKCVLFKGNNQAEYAWFSISDALPFLSMNAERAARRIVRACMQGESEIVLSIPALSLQPVKAKALFPGMTGNVLAIVNHLLPPAEGSVTDLKTGKQSFSEVSPSWVTALNERAAQSNNQIP